MQTQYMDCIKVSDPINHADAGTGFQLDIFNLIKPRRKPHEIEGLFSPAVGKFKKTCGYRGAPCNHNAYEENDLMLKYIEQCKVIFRKFRYYDRLGTWMLASSWYCEAISDLHRTEYKHIQPVKHYEYSWKPKKMPSKFHWFSTDDVRIYGEAKIHNFTKMTNYTYKCRLETLGLNLPDNFVDKLNERLSFSWVIAKTHGHLPDK